MLRGSFALIPRLPWGSRRQDSTNSHRHSAIFASIAVFFPARSAPIVAKPLTVTIGGQRGVAQTLHAEFAFDRIGSVEWRE